MSGGHDIQAPFCPRCDRACERSAELTMALRRATRAMHVLLCHAGSADTCPETDCRQRWALCNGFSLRQQPGRGGDE